MAEEDEDGESGENKEEKTKERVLSCNEVGSFNNLIYISRTSVNCKNDLGNGCT